MFVKITAFLLNFQGICQISKKFLNYPENLLRFIKFLGNLPNPDHFGAVRGRLGALLEAFLEPRNLRNSALFRFRGGPAQKLIFFLDQSQHILTKLFRNSKNH